ncbi:MAG TPA: EthD domain-containing protein [Myxococcota bacterium]|nr:EthD domain-containing protein [Myxococcota bacterium]
MEKIACLLWKPVGVADDVFAKGLRAAAPELARLGAVNLRVNAVDEHVAAGKAVRVGRMDPPKAGFVTFWVDEADAARGALLDALAAHASRVAAYLVVESIPLRNAKYLVPPGERTPGFNAVTGIVPKDGLAYDEFIRLWHTEHRKVALETQSTFAYVRNEIVRALTPDAPAWAAVVEESFPIEALTDQAVWYAAVGSPERLQQNRRRMMESCLAFLALDRVDSHPMSEYVF